MDETKYVDVEIDLDEDILRMLQIMAKNEGVTVDAIVNGLLRSYIDKMSK